MRRIVWSHTIKNVKEREKHTEEVYFFSVGVDKNNPMSQPASSIERLVALRAAVGLSQRGLAMALGIDPTTVAAWETGRHRPSRQSEVLIRSLLPEYR